MLRHRKQLTDTINNVVFEMNGEALSYNDFRRSIEDQILESGKYDQQKEKEKQLVAEIQNITQTHKKLMNDFSQQQEEKNADLSSLKKQVNEALVEKDLHL